MPSQGVATIAADHHPATEPEEHRGYMRLTLEDLAEAGSRGWLRVSVIGGSSYCMIGNVSDAAVSRERDTVLTFRCESRSGIPLIGRVSGTGCTSFRPCF